MKGSKPVVIRTTGKGALLPAQTLLDGEHVDDIDPGPLGTDDQIGPVLNDVPAVSKARRPANLFCYICKGKLGTNLKLRIGEFQL